MQYITLKAAGAQTASTTGDSVYVSGDFQEAETVTGLAATDVVIATITDNSTNDNVILLEAKPSTNTLTLLFNEDPGAGVVVDYVAYRAV